MVMSVLFLGGRFLFEVSIGAILSLLAAAAILYRDKSDPDFAVRQKYLFRTIAGFAVFGWTAFFLSPETFGVAIF